MQYLPTRSLSQIINGEWGPPDPHQDSPLSAKGPSDSLSTSLPANLCHSKYDRSSSSEFDLNFDKESFENCIKDATLHLADDFSQIET